MEFQKPRRAGRTHICDKVSCREQGSPTQKQRQGSRVGAGRGVACVLLGLRPKRLELQVGKAHLGSWKDRLQLAPRSGQETAKGPQDTDNGKGQPQHHLGHCRWDACPCSHSCPQYLSLTKGWEPKSGEGAWGEMEINHQMKFPPAWQNDGTTLKLSSV